MSYFGAPVLYFTITESVFTVSKASQKNTLLNAGGLSIFSLIVSFSFENLIL